MRKRPVSSRPWPPEGYVDPRRLEKPKPNHRATIGLIFAGAVAILIVIRLLARTHDAVSTVAASVPSGSAGGPDQWARSIFWHGPAVLGLIVSIVLAVAFRLRRL